MSGFLSSSRPVRGALVNKSADQTAANYTGSLVTIAWDAEQYDTDGIHDNVTNNTRLTVPAGVTRVRVGMSVKIASHTGDNWIIVSISKNGSFSYHGNPEERTEIGNTAPAATIWSPNLIVSGGDYFEGALRVEADTAIDVTAIGSWFAMEIIE